MEATDNTKIIDNTTLEINEIYQHLIDIAISKHGDQILKTEKNIGKTALIHGSVLTLHDELKEQLECASYIIDNARYFNINSIPEIDYQYWCTLHCWTPEETACLAIGGDPDNMHLIDFLDLETYTRYRNLKRAAERYLDSAQDRTPAQIYRHMKRFGATFPKPIWKALKKNRKYLEKSDRRYFNARNSQIKDGRHRDSLMKLIYALGVHAHNYIPRKHTDAITAIETSIKDAGLTMDRKTIRRLLTAASNRVNSLKSIENSK
ncbi:hypothetical protein [Xanthobacter versatilis]|uniref:hypothetical protein n=1 Tax=Xanthobacter autotrophicus (strain ATCC BAA-1158 / Py2) TaxID=78245 RepID=UPI00372B1B45